MSMIDLDLSHYFNGFKAKSQTVNKVVDNAKQIYNMEFSSMLGGQLFNALYQRDPHLLTVDDPSNQYAQALRAVLKSGQFLALRNQTSGSMAWSAIGASLLVDELAKKLYWQNVPKPEPPDNPQPNKDDENEGESDEPTKTKSSGEGKTETSEEDDENESESGSNSEPNDEEREQDKPDRSESDSDESSDKGDDESSGSDEEDGDDESKETDDSEDGDDTGSSESEQEPLDEQLGTPVDSNIQQAVNDAGEKLENLMNGLNAGAGDKEETFSDAIDLAEMYTGLATNPGLSNLIELVGKLKLNTSFLPAMMVGEPEEVAEVELGDEIEKTLPSDMGLMFGSDEEFFQFMQKLDNKELVQYRTVTHKSPGMGPIVVCLDDSGSMTYGIKGSSHNRDEWAKSLACAIYIQSIKENRPFALVKFSAQAQLLIPERRGRLDSYFLSNLQRTFWGGGTSFDAPWNKAIEFITKDAEGKDFRDADIVFITDGEGGYYPEKIKAQKEEHNIRLVTIFMGSTQRQAMAKPVIEEWAKLTDAMAFVGSLKDSTEAEAFRIIKNHELTGVRDI